MAQPVRSSQKPSNEALKQLEVRSRAFSALGRRLNGAMTTRRVAEILTETADELFGWDACYLDLYSPERDTIHCLLAMDLVAGRRTEVTPPDQEVSPSPKLRQIICDGAQLLLREDTPRLIPGLSPFGDKNRPSASLLFAPVRFHKRVSGVLSLQSYTPRAYREEDLAILQALADHGGGALERIQTEGLLRRTEELYRRAIGGAGAVPYAYDYRTHSYSFIGDGIEQLIGYSAREINYQVWANIIKESVMLGDAAGLGKEEAARRVQTGELRSWRCDMRVLTREGKVRWISDASVQNLDETGRAIGSMGILEDITERKYAELSALALSKLGQNLISAANAKAVARLLSKAGDELFGWDACAFHLYLPEKNQNHQLLYMDTINGQRVDAMGPGLDPTPTAVDRRIMEKGAELILRDGASLSMDPEAVPYGDKSRPSASIMRVPIRLRADKITGIVAFHSYTPQAYSRRDLNALQTMADCCGVALERIWADEALHQSEAQLREVSRQAGMAEVATSVLHNVGNVLNSVNVSYALIAGKVRNSKVMNLGKAVALMQEHAAELGAFLTQDAKGKQLPGYLGNLAEHLAGEQKDLIQELQSLGANIEHIKEIVAMQQSYATVCGVIETLPVVELVEDALRLNAGAMERHQVQVVREYAETPPIPVDRHKVLQILVNLIRNAKYALDDKGHTDKRLILRIELLENKTIRISVIDNGVGIPTENLTRVFEHGFTTRKQGHGFGLHNGALAARELGGSLTAHSQGPGQGATFILELPCQRKKSTR